MFEVGERKMCSFRRRQSVKHGVVTNQGARELLMSGTDELIVSLYLG